jgi:hypothetical protein
MKLKYLLLFPEELILRGYFRGLRYRKAFLMFTMFGKVFKLSVPLYPTGFVRRHLMNVIDEALGRFDK